MKTESGNKQRKSVSKLATALKALRLIGMFQIFFGLILCLTDGFIFGEFVYIHIALVLISSGAISLTIAEISINCREQKM